MAHTSSDQAALILQKLANTMPSATRTTLPADVIDTLTTPVNDWPLAVKLSGYAWCTSLGAPYLTAQNIDPDFVSPPPDAILRTGPPSTVIIDTVRPDPDFSTAISALPNATKHSTRDMWTISVTDRSLPALRTLVVAHKLPLTDAAVTLLRAAAQNTPTADDRPQRTENQSSHPEQPAPLPSQATLTTVDGGYHISGPVPDQAVSALTTTDGIFWSPNKNAFVIAETAIDQACAIATTHHILISPDIAKHRAKVNTDLIFDGTVDGLRGVPLTDLKCVTPKQSEKFAKFGIHNVYDLVFTLPRRYVDRSTIAHVQSLTEGEEVGLIGTVTRINSDPRKRMARIGVHDGTGTITATFFNAAWQARRFKVGDRVIIFGKPERYGKTSAWSMVNPILDPLEETTIPVIPVYPQSGKSGISTWEIHRASAEAIARIPTVTDPLPAQILDHHHLIPRWDALTTMHYPKTLSDVDTARTRLAFDELFRMQTSLLIAKHSQEDEQGVTHPLTGRLTTSLTTSLPFPLTGTQDRAITTILGNMAHPNPMHRLLQGDVGSGKSLVALTALLATVEAGHQGALMAPTEILARQLHTELLTRTTNLTLPDGSPIIIEYVTNKLRGKKRVAAMEALADGTTHIAVGTHALIADDVTFCSLGLVVIDEQHRFGVEQRSSLRDKGPEGAKPDMLIMTATPIPRTSAMTLFGDLDVTVLDELPPGRTPIHTTWIDSEPVLDSDLADPWPSVREHVSRGNQVFVVCPLVEESEKLQATSAKETYDALTFGALHGLRVGLVHGQQKVDERDAIMSTFRDGDLDVIIATTVIEVGVNIPNATLMVVLDSPRFGISQLHQLRGRVGRGTTASECVLVGHGKSPDSRTRMQALVDSTDGFKLAEIDFETRKGGSIFGGRQSGEGDLRVADLFRDRDLLVAARESSQELLENDPQLLRHPTLRAEVQADITDEARAWLSRS